MTKIATLKAVEKPVYQVRGTFNFMGDEQKDPVEFQRMFQADSIPFAEKLAEDWLYTLHGKLRHFEVISIGKAEDIITWES